MTMPSMNDHLQFVTGCTCAGTGCGGHVVFTPIGWQGAAQHTYTADCDGNHPPGPCPPPRRNMLTAIGNGPLLDPGCRDGKHASCIGDPCECECHTGPQPVGADAEPGDLYGPPPDDDHEGDTP